MTPQAMLVCTVAEMDALPKRLIIPGCKVGSCARCNTPVWISPSTARAVLAGQFIPVCTSCLTLAEIIRGMTAGSRPTAEGAEDLKALVKEEISRN